MERTDVLAERFSTVSPITRLAASTPGVSARWRMFGIPLRFLDLNNGLAFVGAAIQTRIMRQLELMALWTHGHSWWGHAQLLGTALIASRSRMFMFWVGHGDSFFRRPLNVVQRSPDSRSFSLIVRNT